MSVEVLITDQPYHVGRELVHQYGAYCQRCLRTVMGPTGNSIWATKPPAVKAAKVHIAQHVFLEGYIERRTSNGTLKVVQSITA